MPAPIYRLEEAVKAVHTLELALSVNNVLFESRPWGMFMVCTKDKMSQAKVSDLLALQPLVFMVLQYNDNTKQYRYASEALVKSNKEARLLQALWQKEFGNPANSKLNFEDGIKDITEGGNK